MATDWDVPATAGTALLSHTDKLEKALESLRTVFSSGSAPAATVAGMLWWDTTNKVIKQRDSADSAWVVFAAAGVKNNVYSRAIRIGGLAASDNFFGDCPIGNVKITDVVIISDTATAGSTGGNNWAVQLRNMTAAVNLRATAWDTNTDAEIGADAATIITLDQNQDVAANDVFEIQITKNGTPTDLTSAEITLLLRGEIRGA